MSRTLKSSVAIAALAAMLAGPALAQDAAPAQEQTTISVPQVLRDAGLTDVESKSSRRGDRIGGTLPDGTQIDAILDGQGQLRGVRSGGDGALPTALIQQLVPQAVRGQAIFAELIKVEAVFTGEQGVMVVGSDAQQKPVRAAFAQDGTLLRFGRGDDKGPDMGPRGGHDRMGKGHEGGHGKGHDGPHDKDRDHKRGDKEHGKRGDDRRDAGRDAPPRQHGTPPSPEQVRASLTKAGYGNIGQILQQGPVTVAQATNPEGEPVLVEIGTKGDVLRELNR